MQTMRITSDKASSRVGPGPGSSGQADLSRAGSHQASSDPASSHQASSHQASSHQASSHQAVSRRSDGRPQALRTVRDLAIDLGIPLGSYYLLRDGFGASTWLSLAVSCAGPAVRSAWSMATRHEVNLLAALMLVVNVAGIAVSFLTGDPRAMIAKDSVVSSVIAFAMLGSVVTRRPLMTPGLRLFLTKGTPEREAAWDRLQARSARFRRLAGLYTTIWGIALLGECIARLAGAYTLPVTTMVWLGGMMTLGAIGLAILLGGVAAGPMLGMIERETAMNTAAASGAPR